MEELTWYDSFMVAIYGFLAIYGGMYWLETRQLWPLYGFSKVSMQLLNVRKKAVRQHSVKPGLVTKF